MNRMIHSALTALAAVLLTASCNTLGDPFAKGAINFNANSAPETRTSYSGELIGTQPDRWERINWQPGYDRIRIASPEAATMDGDHWHDYVVEATSETNASGFRYSRAALSATDGGRGLHWGEAETQHFYAIYPAATSTSPSGRTLGSTEFTVTATASGGTVTGTIPATQAYESKTGATFYPDMIHAPMWAFATGQKGNLSGVYLSFAPLFDAYELSIRAGDQKAEDYILKNVRLTSATDYLSGVFTASITPQGAITISDSFTGAQHYAEVAISAADRTAFSPTTFVTVTILTLPCDQAKLTLDLTFDNGNAEVHRRVDFKSDANGDHSYSDAEWFTMQACKKVYIRNINVPGQLPYIELTAGLDPWTGNTYGGELVFDHTEEVSND